jgi:hypothetical protein
VIGQPDQVIANPYRSGAEACLLWVQLQRPETELEMQLDLAGALAAAFGYRALMLDR